MGMPLACVVIPRIISHNLDPHTGIPFMPHMAAHLAASLRANGLDTQVIDSFGSDFRKIEILDNFMLQGINECEVIERISSDVEVIFVYCRTIEDLLSSERICRAIRKSMPSAKIVMFENIQTVNSFSLSEVIGQFHAEGIVDVGIFGEPEDRAVNVFYAIKSRSELLKIPGISLCSEKFAEPPVFTTPNLFNNKLNELEFPAWDLFQLDGYWNCGFAHAPITPGDKFLPILTSRGCPYRCTFCVSPAINPTWRSRSAVNVVDEMEYFFKLLNVTDFHVSDLDPTIVESRMVEISNEIIRRNLDITWKIAQGTKIETIKKKSTLTVMKQSGCNFFSFSPETGSEKLLKLINKRFDQDHALELTKHMSKIRMKTQACFIAGVPGEDYHDRLQSIKYVRKLARAGIDEIAVSIFTPIPGAKLGGSLLGFQHYSELSHSPMWREDYREVSKFRWLMYLNYFSFQFLYHPTKSFREVFGVLTGKVQTKMEMSLRKIILVRFRYLKAKFLSF